MSAIQQLLAYPLSFIMVFLYDLVKNYGLALILFALITKLLQFPIALSTQKTQAQMAVFQPMVRDIQKKYANNREKMNEEMLRLQQDYGYKMTGGCLPMVVQLLVMLGLIDVVYKPLTYLARIPKEAVEKATEIAKGLPGFIERMSAQQLSVQQVISQNPEAFSEVLTGEQVHFVSNMNFQFLGLDLTRIPTIAFNLLIIIPILMVATGILSQIYSMKRSGQMAAGGGTMAGMLIFSNVMMAFFAFQIPAAVSIYWIVGNLWTIPQSFIVGKIFDPEKIRKEKEAEIAEIRKNKNKKKKTVEKKTVQIETEGKVIEKELSEKEYYKMRMAKARELDAKKYAEDGLLQADAPQGDEE